MSGSSDTQAPPNAPATAPTAELVATPATRLAAPPPLEVPRLETRIVRRKLRELKRIPKEENARFMRSATYRRLVENLKTDGELTSTPLIYRDLVLSGNHRVEAALDAGIEEADCKEILSDIPPDRARAIQLSHNELEGEDDPGILARLYDGLDFTWKKYSGLTDERVGLLQKLDVTALALGAPAYQELVLLFLPEDRDRFDRALASIEGKLSKGTTVHAGRFDDFAAFFDAMVSVKKVRNVHNSALALRVMAEIAMEVLEREDAEQAVARAAERQRKSEAQPKKPAAPAAPKKPSTKKTKPADPTG